MSKRTRALPPTVPVETYPPDIVPPKKASADNPFICALMRRISDGRRKRRASTQMRVNARTSQ